MFSNTKSLKEIDIGSVWFIRLTAYQLLMSYLKPKFEIISV